MEMVAQTARMNGEVHKTSGLRISLNWLEAGREKRLLKRLWPP